MADDKNKIQKPSLEKREVNASSGLKNIINSTSVATKTLTFSEKEKPQKENQVTTSEHTSDTGPRRK